jgi:hypothetical protein
MNTTHPTLAPFLWFAPPSSEVHRSAEDARLQADLHNNELKNSGELERRRIEAAIRLERPHPWEITL